MEKILTIRHKRTQKLMEVSPSEFETIRGRSRNWEKIGERIEKPAKKAKSEPEESATETIE